LGDLTQSAPAYRRITTALFAGALATYASLYTTQPILPLLSQTLHITPTMASLTVSVASAGLAVGLLFAGPLADSLGRKAVMNTSLVAASIIGVVAAFAPGISSLLVLRALEGFVLAGLPSTAMAYLAEEIDPRALGAAMGLYVSGNSVGGMGGRIIAGMIGDLISWRAAVGAIALLALCCAVYFWRTLPPSRHFRPQPLNLSRLAGSLLQCLRDPGLLCLYGISYLIMGSFIAMYNYISYTLVAPPYRLSGTIVGWIFLLYLSGTFSSTWMGRLSDRYSRRKVLWIGIVIELTGALVTLGAPLAAKIAGLAIFTFGFFGAHSIASGWVGERARVNRGAASSLYLFFYYMGSSTTGTFGGQMYQRFGWPGVALMIACFVTVALGISGLLVRICDREARTAELEVAQ
jgi:YNFM family putative membrane transporter